MELSKKTKAFAEAMAFTRTREKKMKSALSFIDWQRCNSFSL